MKMITWLRTTIVACSVLTLPLMAHAEGKFVALPKIDNNTVAPRILYIENPRFPKIAPAELQRIARAAADLIEDHFAITVKLPQHIPTRNIDGVFADLVGQEPPGLKDLIGDFRHDNVAWDVVRDNLAEQISTEKEPLSQQIAFARPYLTAPLQTEDVAGFADAVTETFKQRLSHWTVAKLKDGNPVIGKVPGRPDYPLNEYGYWTLMAKLGIDADIVLTNQLVASVEYIPVPVHTSIRGGITGGSTEYNPASPFGASVWVSLFPYVSDDPHIVAYRNGDSYDREDALTYAGAMVAHEMGHLLLQLGHPWSNKACLMRPAEMLDFAPWVENFNAANCKVGSSTAMQPGTIKAPIW